MKMPEEELSETQVYALLGEDGFARLVGGFYRRVRADDLLARLYPQHDFDAAEVRLREFLIQRFGGPTRYSDSRGHPRLRMRHAPFKVDLAARNRWVELMEAAMMEAELPTGVESILRRYFHDTATFMINQAG